MRHYDFYKREFNPSWSVIQIEELLKVVIEKKSSTLISYAALEGRINIERIEYEILLMSGHNLVGPEFNDIIGDYKGIQKVNSQIKALRYRYQTFTEAFSNVIVDEFSLKPFDFKKAEELQSNLSHYIHIYTREPSDIFFESDYMQKGISLIKETISFFNNMFTIHDGAYIYGILDFNSLKNGFEIEFKKWLVSVDNDVDALTIRLKNIAENLR
jgi:hypothetical protein